MIETKYYWIWQTSLRDGFIPVFVENGKQKIPHTWFERICSLYSLDVQQTEAFSLAIAETDETVSVNLQGTSAHNRELAVSFARSFQDFSYDDIEAIKKILFGAKANNGAIHGKGFVKDGY